ncbi:zf-C2HC5-domain-containing protein [Aspergillus heteromorphus CBS 117.55]|uniref:Zf-C2HC5-domain-containing protein n=1 Tax=Aspergillus heteromorphus CBS 117.55 TaxID=1448321 RepID=A0A317WAZ1_9EURO|nr:zf-C2HC5-domain-containing protein [Aspergillus heteromorphus CBS 117.55]PWY83513.1 zf-C2HC5-domain-containing protein [Aspergillus heteromorphus CBS 117.55]
MSNPGLITWGVPRLAQLLPLDEESLTQIITYTASLSKEEGAEHLKNFLGDSPAAFEFIAAFSSRREPPPPARSPAVPSVSSGVSPSSTTPAARNTTSGGKRGKKSKPPLHSAGPVRRPENFGNVVGGYRKGDQDEDYMSSSGRNTMGRQDAGAGAGAGAGNILASSRETSATSSRNQSPVPRQHTPAAAKNPPSAAGPVISDLLPNVKSKAAKPSSARAGGGGGGGGGGRGGNAFAKGGGALTTNMIHDLTAAISALEMSTNPTLGGEGRKCSCYASIHPLFEAAPNCLNCGKIICSLEGLQPCSFCGTRLLSDEEIQSMIRELRAERGQEKMRVHNEGVHREDGPGPGSGSSKLDAAKAHRDKLLQFQANNAKRTRVVDEAADFETPNVASTLWMTPAQRALALKKQQRVQREMDEKARPEWEKKKTIMSLDIKGGRVTRVYQSAGPAETGPSAEEDAEEELADGGSRESSGKAFSHNPLLAAGGLLRPVWKPTDGEQPDAERRERKQASWRRVQDDNDDNEQWILDGGLHGHT